MENLTILYTRADKDTLARALRVFQDIALRDEHGRILPGQGIEVLHAVDIPQHAERMEKQ